jgi:ATP-binding cassette subfamily B protein
MGQCVIYFVEAKAEPSFSYKLKKHISIKMFEKAISVDISCYEDKTYYDKYCVAMTHAYERCNEELDALTRLIEAVTTFIVSGMLSLLINPIIIVFAFLPFSTLVFRNKKNSIVHTTNQKISDINRKKEYVMRTFYQDIYAKEMRTTSIHRPLLERFLNASREIKEVYKKDGVRATWIWIVESFLNMAFSEYLVLIYAAWETLVKKTMRYGDCLVIVSAMQSIYDATNEILECVSKLHEHSLYINDLRAFLKYESKEGQDSCAIEASCGDIIFKNVSFRYKNCDKNVLCNVNLHIKKGEKVALVGANGAGKTTLIKLMLRLYDATEGEISINGINYKCLDTRSLRNCYSIVLQDYKHFSISIKDNICLGDEMDYDRMHSAIEKSGLSERISKMANGVDTMLDKEIDDSGEILSGGEQQKLAIARMYYQNNGIMILDEPASALDPVAEHDLYERMMALSKDKTVMFVSHRLSSTVMADKIIYFENGSVAEYGSHEELMALNGKYANMFKIQAKNYMED